MKRYVGIFDVDSFHKEGTDQKGIGNETEETVTTILKRNGYCYSGSPDVFGKIELHTTDSKAPDWKEVFVVTVEKIELPPNQGSNITDFLEQVLKERREGLEKKPITVGRKFR